MTRSLTQRQEAFCVNYFETGSVNQAARAAGYTPSSARSWGSCLLRTPRVAARIKELRQRVEDDAVMKVLERKRKLSEIGRAGSDPSLHDPIRAIDLLNRMDGIYREQQPQTTTNTLIINVSSPEAKTLVERVMRGDRQMLQSPWAQAPEG